MTAGPRRSIQTSITNTPSSIAPDRTRPASTATSDRKRSAVPGACPHFAALGLRKDRGGR